MLLFQHIQPQAYFQKQPDAVATDFMGDIAKGLGRELTAEERVALGAPPTPEDVDVDIITRD